MIEVDLIMFNITYFTAVERGKLGLDGRDSSGMLEESKGRVEE